ncbi:hypothetical protein HY490_04395 [Candidatus Woesearchaeota archaeon]|nr:hypothetical protein [Candidatus Woesearchaeota archaeon]
MAVSGIIHAIIHRERKPTLDELLTRILSPQGITLDGQQRRTIQTVDELITNGSKPPAPTPEILEVSNILRNALRWQHTDDLMPYGQAFMQAYCDWARTCPPDQRRDMLDYELDFFVLTKSRRSYVDRARQLARLAGVENDPCKKQTLYAQVISAVEQKGALTPEWHDDFLELKADAHIGLAELLHDKQHYAAALNALSSLTEYSEQKTGAIEGTVRHLAKTGKCYYGLAKLADSTAIQMRCELKGIEMYKQSATYELKILRLLPAHEKIRKLPYFVRSLQRLATGMIRVGRYVAREHKVPTDILCAAAQHGKRTASLPKGKLYNNACDIAYGLLNAAERRIKHAYRVVWQNPGAFTSVDEVVAHCLLTQAQANIAQAKIKGLAAGWRRLKLEQAKKILGIIPCAPEIDPRKHLTLGELYTAYSVLDATRRTSYTMKALQHYTHAAPPHPSSFHSSLIAQSYLNLATLLSRKDVAAIPRIRQCLRSLRAVPLDEVADVCYKRAINYYTRARRAGDNSPDNLINAADAYLGLARRVVRRLKDEIKFTSRVNIRLAPDDDLESTAMVEQLEDSHKNIDNYRKQLRKITKSARKCISLAPHHTKNNPDYHPKLVLLEAELEGLGKEKRVYKATPGSLAEKVLQLAQGKGVQRVDTCDALNKVVYLRLPKHTSSEGPTIVVKRLEDHEKETKLAQLRSWGIKHPEPIMYIQHPDGKTVVIEKRKVSPTVFNYLHAKQQQINICQASPSHYSQAKVDEIHKTILRTFRRCIVQWNLQVDNIENNYHNGSLSKRILMKRKPEDYLSYVTRSIEPRLSIHADGKTLKDTGFLPDFIIPHLVAMKRRFGKDLQQSNAFIDGTGTDFDVLTVSHYQDDPAIFLEPYLLTSEDILSLAMNAVPEAIKRDISDEQLERDFLYSRWWASLRMSAHYWKRQYDTRAYARQTRISAVTTGDNVPITQREEKRRIQKYEQRYQAHVRALYEIAQEASQNRVFPAHNRHGWHDLADYISRAFIGKREGPFESSKDQTKH